MRGGSNAAAGANNNAKKKKAAAAPAAAPAVDLCDTSDDDSDSEIEITAVRGATRTTGGAFVGRIPRKELGAQHGSTNGGSAADTTTTNTNEERELARAIAASNRDIARDQDEEYHRSLAADRAKADARRREEEEQREREELDRTLEASRAHAAEEERERRRREKEEARRQLEEEPPKGMGPRYETEVAFRLPASCGGKGRSRVVRRFSPTASVSQLYCFLRTCDEMDGVRRWVLCLTQSGMEEVAEDDERYLEALGLAPRGLVIVKDMDA